jgi:hypothetical protein
MHLHEYERFDINNHDITILEHTQVGGGFVQFGTFPFEQRPYTLDY